MVGDLVRWIRRTLPQGHPIAPENWDRRHFGILCLLWAHVLIVPVFGISQGLGAPHSILEASVIGALAMVASTKGLSRPTRAVFATLGLITSSAILTHFSGGVIEMHFHFFVMVAVVTLYQSWLPFVVAIGYVVLHHGILGAIDPSGVYNHPEAIAQPWKWALVHGFFILAESTACLIAWRMNEISLESERNARTALERVNVELAEAQELAHMGSWEWNLITNELWWSDELYRIFAVPKDFEPSYQRFLELIHPDDRARVSAVVESAAVVDGTLEYESRVVRGDGEERIVHALGGVTTDATGAAQRMIGTCQDITERKALEQEVEHQAFHDALTGLANRALFLNRVEHALALSERNRSQLTVLFIDLDGFKAVNDTLGHSAGDELLRKVASQLSGSLRPADTIARIGGDEFAILLEGSGLDAATSVVRRLQADSEKVVILGDRELTVRSSIGIVQAQGHASAEELLRDADTAMYAAKNKKEDRGSHAVFEPGMRDSIVRRLELKTELARAIANSELVLHFQPLVDLPTQTIGGFEALVRWEHATRGLIPPFDFIPLAEETGLIVPLGEWVLREATMRAKQLQEETGRPLYMAINLSARQLLQTDVVGSVSKALLESKMDPADIVLEITETSLMEDAQAGERVLHELRELGVRIAIDDFGTGYSSLSYLKQFPIDILKIDRTFVSSITEGPEESALAEALIHLSRILSLDTVAEGIEREGQEATLRRLGCRLGQGYLYARPLSPEQAGELLGGRSLGQAA
ncbi:MAG: hypothetical protein QOH90_905 [Actinomycetota bacterium]|nr:hypothetical protein [Actinomycetota bacterium]